MRATPARSSRQPTPTWLAGRWRTAASTWPSWTTSRPWTCRLTTTASSRSTAGSASGPLADRARDSPIAGGVAGGVVHPKPAVVEPCERHVFRMNSVDARAAVPLAFDREAGAFPGQPILRRGHEDPRAIAGHVGRDGRRGEILAA